MKIVYFLIFLLYNSVFCYEVYLDAQKSLERKTLSKVVVTSSDIEKSGKKNIFEVLEFYGLDIYKRFHTQVDFGLNSSTFEQVKIYINGIPFNNPQTGHHNCELPISVEDIDYVEIIKNDNFAKYGNYAFGGVMNIVTKSSSKNTLRFEAGSFNTYLFNSNFSKDNVYFSFDYSFSDGFRYNTDYNNFKIFSNLNFEDLNVFLGVLDKKFGAQDFYTTPNTRKEYEQIKTIFAGINFNKYIKENVFLDTNVFFKNGYDFYTTQRYNPQLYSNYHNVYVFGSSSKLNLFYKNLKLNPILELTFKYLDSKGYSSVVSSWKGLGEFFDTEYMTGVNCEFNYKKIYAEVSTMLNYLTRYKFLPQYGLKFSFRPKSTTELFSSVSYVFRTPSYTELYYWDPFHVGEESLKIEKSINYNLGVNKQFFEKFRISLSGFFYLPMNAIDWVRTKNSTESWKVSNIAKVETYGVNLNLNLNYGGFDAEINYIYTKKLFELEPTKELKYIENYPKNSLNLVFNFPEFYGFRVSMLNKYKELTKTTPRIFYITDLSLIKTYKNFKFNVSIENLFNIKYEEVPGIPQPPRSLFVKIELFLN